MIDEDKQKIIASLESVIDTLKTTNDVNAYLNLSFYALSLNSEIEHEVNLLIENGEESFGIMASFYNDKSFEERQEMLKSLILQSSSRLNFYNVIQDNLDVFDYKTPDIAMRHVSKKDFITK